MAASLSSSAPSLWGVPTAGSIGVNKVFFDVSDNDSNSQCCSSYDVLEVDASSKYSSFSFTKPSFKGFPDLLVS
ncbi:hypothetical protein IEQ34_005880 [Dendrobium chrysotoxum]|uniref:Uncharacterized protein n=1 Tax=Dendrobium chrysotoxum TaxID=161865 RepID=A0AAV7H9U5_DENCH|nr:hypothetical protein IEQ34_005880 [Dendrobium chrysotoxum]